MCSICCFEARGGNQEPCWQNHSCVGYPCENLGTNCATMDMMPHPRMTPCTSHHTSFILWRLRRDMTSARTGSTNTMTKPPMAPVNRITPDTYTQPSRRVRHKRGIPRRTRACLHTFGMNSANSSVMPMTHTLKTMTGMRPGTGNHREHSRNETQRNASRTHQGTHRDTAVRTLGCAG